MTTEISFEFFPPRSPSVAERLRATVRTLAAQRPAFYSVTYGAGGSSRELTLDTVRDIERECAVETVPHIAALGTSRAEVGRLLRSYAESGVRRLVAIRGDLPEGGIAAAGEMSQPDDSPRHGAELVRLIRALETVHFRVYVGAYPEQHPESSDLLSEVRRFAEKVSAGADAAITQYFYNSDAYESFLELAATQRVAIPIIAGIMPIHDFEQIARFSARCGAEIPRWLASRMHGFTDPESQRDFAADVVARLCERLATLGAPGFHFYTLNRAAPTLAVLERAGLAR